MAGNFYRGARMLFHEVGRFTDFQIVCSVDDRAVGGELNPQVDGFYGLRYAFAAILIHFYVGGSVRAAVLTVHHAVIIAVQLAATAVYSGSPRGVGALVAAVGHAIAIGIELTATAVYLNTGRSPRALIPGIGHTVVVGIRRGGFGGVAVEGKAQPQRHHGVEGAFVDTMEFAQVATQGDVVTDVVTDPGTQVYPGFVVVGARGKHRAAAKVCVAGAEGEVWVPGRILASQIVQAIKPKLIEFGVATNVFAVCVRAGVYGFYGPAGGKPIFQTHAVGVGFTQIPFVAKILITGKRIEVNGLFICGEGRCGKGCSEKGQSDRAHDLHAEPPVCFFVYSCRAKSGTAEFLRQITALPEI